jgi:hypothetical protein
VSAFRSDLILRDLGDGRRFELVAPLVYESDRRQATLIVPAGTITDLASIPLLGNHRTWSRAAVVHDFLYQTNGVSRSEADAVLGEAMLVLGVPAWRRWIVLGNLRVFGWRAWNKHREAQV